MGQQLLQLERVGKVFCGHKETVALTDVSFAIQEGEFVVILGSSGCGKTTLLRLISGLDFPTQGTVTYRGTVVTGPSVRRGYVFQEPRLFPWLTVEQNVALTTSADPLAWLAAMGLSHCERAYPHELSGGMRKRVALARAVASRPELLLLDEPLANLDIPAKDTLLQQLTGLWQQRFTLLMVTHDVDEALLAATRLLVIRPSPGRVVADFVLPLPFPRQREDPDYQEWRTRLIALLLEVNAQALSN